MQANLTVQRDIFMQTACKAHLLKGRNWEVYKPNKTKVSLMHYIRKALKESDKNLLGNELSSGREGHSLKVITYNNQKFFLKIFDLSSKLAWNRRIEFSVKELLQSRAKKSFYGALKLEKAGIPTAEPVGYCTFGIWPWKKKGIAICEYLANDGNVQDYLKVCKTNQPVLLSKMAHLAKKLHDHGLRHTDIVEHNFLVKRNCHEMLEIFLVDTDKVHCARVSKFVPFIKQYLDLRCLMRLKYTKPETEWFLREYFGSDYRTIWLHLLFFLRNGGFSIKRRLKIKKTSKLKLG